MDLLVAAAFVDAVFFVEVQGGNAMLFAERFKRAEAVGKGVGVQE